MTSPSVFHNLRVLAFGHFQAFSFQLELLMQAFEAEGARAYRTTYKRSIPAKVLSLIIDCIRWMPRSDVVVLQGHSTLNVYQTAIGIFFAKLFRKPTILLFYGGKLAEEYPKRAWIFNWVFRNSTRILVASGYIGGVIEGRGFETTTIPHIVRGERWPHKQRETIRPNLVYLRSMDREDYNPMLAIRAFRKVLKEYPDATMTMIGKGDGRQELIDTVKREGLPVTFMMNTPHEEVIDVFAAHDIFVNTPNFDNQPVCLIEAMLSGLPIVTTNVGGIPWMFEDGEVGWFVDRDDDEAMAQRILDLLRDPETGRRMSAQGKITGQKWLWPQLKTQYERVLNDVLPGRR